MTTQDVALAVSVLALVVAGLAAFIAWKSFRRAGARVAVDLDVRAPERVSNAVVAGHIGLSIENKGLAPIGLNSAIWLVESDAGTRVAIIEADEGPPLPLTLAGLYSAQWSFDFEDMSSRVPSGVHRFFRRFFRLDLGDRLLAWPPPARRASAL
jgi:hypothetical protein